MAGRFLAPLAAVLMLAGCSSGGSSGAASDDVGKIPEGPPSTSYGTVPVAPVTTHKAAPRHHRAKPCTGPAILERTSGGGVSPTTIKVSGRVLTVTGCVDSLQVVEDSAPTDGCIDVALASDNPGYDLSADPAPRLRHVFASVGALC